jgi:hypothetical protein
LPSDRKGVGGVGGTKHVENVTWERRIGDAPLEINKSRSQMKSRKKLGESLSFHRGIRFLEYWDYKNQLVQLPHFKMRNMKLQKGR